MQLFIVIASFVIRRNFTHAEWYVFGCSIKGKGTKSRGAEERASHVPPHLIPGIVTGKAFEGWVICPLKLEVEGKQTLMGVVIGPQGHHLIHAHQTSYERQREQMWPVSPVSWRSLVISPHIAYPRDLSGSYHLTWLQGSTGLWCLEESCKEAQVGQRKHHDRKDMFVLH